jgi:hypothetical protein
LFCWKKILILPTADPGFIGVHPGNGVNTCPPVSVCQKVSTMEHFSCPITLWYQCHASGLMGSPTDPSTCNVLKLCLFRQKEYY